MLEIAGYVSGPTMDWASSQTRRGTTDPRSPAYTPKIDNGPVHDRPQRPNQLSDQRQEIWLL